MRKEVLGPIVQCLGGLDEEMPVVIVGLGDTDVGGCGHGQATATGPALDSRLVQDVEITSDHLALPSVCRLSVLI